MCQSPLLVIRQHGNILPFSQTSNKKNRETILENTPRKWTRGKQLVPAKRTYTQIINELPRQEPEMAEAETMEVRLISPSFLNKLSCFIILLSSLAIVLLSIRLHSNPISLYCPPPTRSHFPRTSCDALRREFLSPDRKLERLRSTRDWQKRVTSYSDLFRSFGSAGILKNGSKMLIVSAGAGHEVAGATDAGVSDVTGVEIFESVPLVTRADPHNLPFFDAAFDFAFNGHLTESLFPARVVSEMERTLRVGGAAVLAVGEGEEERLRKIEGLFKRSELVDLRSVGLAGEKFSVILMRKKLKD